MSRKESSGRGEPARMDASRRRFMAAGLHLAALQIVAPWNVWGAAGESAAAAQPLEAKLLGCVGRRGSAAALGREYLRRHPQESDRAGLVALLRADLRETGGEPEHAAPRRVREMVRRRCAADFEAARVVELQGWILSRTESRLYALASLS